MNFSSWIMAARLIEPPMEPPTDLPMSAAIFSGGAARGRAHAHAIIPPPH